MLKEIESAQKEKEIFRKWYKDEFFDLIVWFDNKNESIIGFQLCYDIIENEHSFIWTLDNGFKHNKIDSGSIPLKYPSSPINCPDGLFNTQFIFDKFIDSCLRIDKLISLFIMIKIIEFGNLNIKIEELINLLYKKSIYIKKEDENINLLSSSISNNENQNRIITKEIDILDTSNNNEFDNDNTIFEENEININKKTDGKFNFIKYILGKISK